MTQFDDILLAPWVIQGSNSICLEVIRGEGFTPLDFSQFFGLGGVDPYVQLQFGNETPTVSSSSRATASRCGTSSSRCR